MPKKYLIIILVLLVAGLGWYFYSTNLVVEVSDEEDVFPVAGQTPTQNDEQAETPAIGEKEMVSTAKLVLSALRTRDYQRLEELTSPSGLTLNLTPSLDLRTIHAGKDEVSELKTNTETYLFGYTDGQGEPINMTTAQFIDKWIYTHDYEKAPQVGVNKILGQGNSLNSIIKDVTPREFVSFHYPGIDPQYEGMDWTTIYLIFDQTGGQYKLRAIAKDNWTI
ncbi:MAG TPA: hypothetical protein VI752_01410 [Candidatus Paceibacterota bacterium]